MCLNPHPSEIQPTTTGLSKEVSHITMLARDVTVLVRHSVAWLPVLGHRGVWIIYSSLRLFFFLHSPVISRMYGPENRMSSVMLTVTIYNFTFRPNTSDFREQLLLYTLCVRNNAANSFTLQTHDSSSTWCVSTLPLTSTTPTYL